MVRLFVYATPVAADCHRYGNVLRNYLFLFLPSPKYAVFSRPVQFFALSSPILLPVEPMRQIVARIGRIVA